VVLLKSRPTTAWMVTLLLAADASSPGDRLDPRISRKATGRRSEDLKDQGL
jgi:hypothetical protein